MTQLLKIHALWIPNWQMIMIRHKKSGNWKIRIKVDFCINDLQLNNRHVDMEYNDQSHHPIVSLALNIAPYNDEWWKLIFGIKVWK
jgi:hypothetical protein